MNCKKTIFSRKHICVRAIILILMVSIILAFDNRLLIRRYRIDAKEISSPIRIALVTDLHSCKYGDGQTELIKALTAQKPDLVFLVGDIFDDVIENTNSELFLTGIANKYPCYYVTGNHEYWGGKTRFDHQMTILKNSKITVLSDETVTLTVNGEEVNLCGVNDPDMYMIETNNLQDIPKNLLSQSNKDNSFIQRLEAVSQAVSDHHYTILLSHRPEYFETYADYPFDLVLCGHAHGGQWRIPYLLNGLYAPHQGLFPKYAGGRYDTANMTMLVSRGLARETTWIPRIFNRPELVVIDLE